MKNRLVVLSTLGALAAVPTLATTASAAPSAPAPAQQAAQAAQQAPQTAPRGAHCARTLETYPILRPGARRPAVRTLQCAINDAGYGRVTVDGYYGPQTRRAVRRIEGGFEGPPPHPGRINNGFWTLLFGRQLPSHRLQAGDHGHAVTVLQRALRAAGGDLVVDGDFGAQTRSVVKAYQREHGIKKTGRAGHDTIFYLGQGAVFGDLN